MIAQVSKGNLVAVPDTIAREHGIRPGTRLDWQTTAQADELKIKVMPDYAALATELLGAGRKHLKPGDDPIAALVADREAEDREREASL